MRYRTQCRTAGAHPHPDDHAACGWVGPPQPTVISCLLSAILLLSTSPSLLCSQQCEKLVRNSLDSSFDRSESWVRKYLRTCSLLRVTASKEVVDRCLLNIDLRRLIKSGFCISPSLSQPVLDGGVDDISNYLWRPEIFPFPLFLLPLPLPLPLRLALRRPARLLVAGRKHRSKGHSSTKGWRGERCCCRARAGREIEFICSSSCPSSRRSRL